MNDKTDIILPWVDIRRIFSILYNRYKDCKEVAQAIAVLKESGTNVYNREFALSDYTRENLKQAKGISNYARI